MSTYALDLDGLTVYITDGGGRRDLNASGEPCRTLAELRAFIDDIYAEGGFKSSPDADAAPARAIRDRLLAEI